LLHFKYFATNAVCFVPVERKVSYVPVTGITILLNRRGRVSFRSGDCCELLTY